MEFRANEAATIDEPVVREALDHTRWVVQQRKDAAKGIKHPAGDGRAGCRGLWAIRPTWRPATSG